MNDVTTGEHTDLLRELDESAITRTHWKIMFISGMGFFTDAYDLFVIGVVMTMLKEQWHVSPTADGLVTSTALLASAIGAVLFGRIADMLGRKRIYGFEVLVLAAGAVASALSPDIWWLIVFRFILGIGIGGDYPVSSTIMGEYAGKKTRGLLITLVFAMQAAGLVFGPALAAVLLASGLSHTITWRLLLAFGAVPAMACSGCGGGWRKRHATCWQAASTKTSMPPVMHCLGERLPLPRPMHGRNGAPRSSRASPASRRAAT
jgi:MFS family permease